MADDFSSPFRTEQCLMPNQALPVGDPYVISPATKHNKNLLIHFINSLSKGSGIYTLISLLIFTFIEKIGFFFV